MACRYVDAHWPTADDAEPLASSSPHVVELHRRVTSHPRPGLTLLTFVWPQIYSLAAQCATLFYGLMIKAEGNVFVDSGLLPLLIACVDVGVLLYPIYPICISPSRLVHAEVESIKELPSRALYGFLWILPWSRLRSSSDSSNPCSNSRMFEASDDFTRCADADESEDEDEDEDEDTVRSRRLGSLAGIGLRNMLAGLMNDQGSDLHKVRRHTEGDVCGEESGQTRGDSGIARSRSAPEPSEIVTSASFRGLSLDSKEMIFRCASISKQIYGENSDSGGEDDFYDCDEWLPPRGYRDHLDERHAQRVESRLMNLGSDAEGDLDLNGELCDSWEDLVRTTSAAALTMQPHRHAYSVPAPRRTASDPGPVSSSAIHGNELGIVKGRVRFQDEGRAACRSSNTAIAPVSERMLCPIPHRMLLVSIPEP
jgi:hypothetical protein